jgi:S1-C subfamily serine protease
MTIRRGSLEVVATLVLFVCLLSGGTAAAASPPYDGQLPKDVKVPNDAAVAIYLPSAALKYRFYVSTLGIWAEPGRSLEDARREIGARYFTQAEPADFASDASYGLFIDLEPKWSYEKLNLKLEIHYRVYGPDASKLLDGTESQTVGINSSGMLGGFPNAANRVTQLVLLDVLRQLHPNAARFPATAHLAALNRDLVIDRTRPVSTGTAFYINKTGQLMTAAHVVRDCLVLEAQKDGKVIPVKLSASSDMLDLAIVDSGQPSEHALPLRIGEETTLGEPVTNVGYPLQGILSSSPNLTRGNVSARGGLKGSQGIFQFSAPVQPGSSGGPVVSDGGELLGITVGTLNAAALIQQGLLPQNVNFALDARYAAKFLHQAKVDFSEVTPNTKGDMRTANEAALASVLQLSCYE